MDEILLKEVRDGLQSGLGIDALEQQLVSRGYLETEVSEALSQAQGAIQTRVKAQRSRYSRAFCVKEVFDRIGYGFGSQQFINILFMESGATYFSIAIVNGIRSLIGSFFSSFMNEYASHNIVRRQIMGWGGIFFGFCFIIMAVARFYHSSVIFALALILAGVGVITYGELYTRFLDVALKGEKSGSLEKIYRYGLSLTVLSIFVGAFLMDLFPTILIHVTIPGLPITLQVTGYLLVFEIAAFCFIISGYILSLVPEEHSNKSGIKEMAAFVPWYTRHIIQDVKVLLKNSSVVMLVTASTVTGLVQLLGNCFYGIFIYQYFRSVGFGGFANVAMIFVLALVASLLTPVITKENIKAYGKFPMLVFGTMLMAIMPLTFYFNPNLISIAMGTIAGVLGAAIVGIANGFVAQEVIPENLRESYFSLNALFTVIPFIITVPLGAFAAQTIGLGKLFLLLGISILLFVVPIYLTLLILSERGSLRKLFKA